MQNIMIDRRVKIYGILGSSLKHSLSPMIFNSLFGMHGIGAAYTTFEISQTDLDDAMTGIRSLGISGVNVTYPYKQMVIKYLDRLDKSASEAGAVNLVKNRMGILTGYNTDIFGIEKTLNDVLQINLKDKHVCLIGAGGAARACLNVFRKSDPSGITILNRTETNAKKLAKDIQIKSAIAVLSVKKLFKSGKFGNTSFDLVINASSANKKTTAMILSRLDETYSLNDSCFFDLNYGARATMNNLPEGISKSTDGFYMLAAQAARNFHIWFNRNIKITEIYDLLIQNERGDK